MNETAYELPDTPVYFREMNGHEHWTWHCPKPTGCGYHTPFFDPIPSAAQKAYEDHLTTCPRTPR